MKYTKSNNDKYIINKIIKNKKLEKECPKVLCDLQISIESAVKILRNLELAVKITK